MNEEFSDYELIVAKSDGGEITQDISWKVEASTDIVVWCDIAGLMDKGTFYYDGNKITINGYDKPFTAYIMRKECAEYVISQNSSSTFSVDVILEQLKKNVRVLEQLEETDTRTLQCVDAVNPITDKDNRKGKVLSFDDEGNPVCEVEVDDVEKIKAYRDEASTSADDASKSESSALTILSDTQTLVSGFDKKVAEKQSAVIDAIDSHFSDITIELDEYADGTISEIESIKNQAQTSATNAQASATKAQALVDDALEIVDPEGFRQDTSANITDLQLFKANTGALHFNGGNAQCSGLANKPIPNVNTIAFRWKCDVDTFANIPVSQRVVGYVSSWYHLARISGGLQFYVKYADGPQFIGLTESNIISLLTDGNWHNVAIISTGTTFDFAIDGKILKSVKRTKTTDFAIPTTNFIVSYSTTNIGSIADVFIFNFDMSSADAPYTIEDYQQGKPIPPKALEYTILALENYTITNGNSKIVFDYSGNNNDATITGDVKGDNDNRVQKLVDFITTLS